MPSEGRGIVRSTTDVAGMDIRPSHSAGIMQCCYRFLTIRGRHWSAIFLPVPLADPLVGLVRSVSMPDTISISSMESFAYSITSSNKEEKSNTGVSAVRSPSLTNEEIDEIFDSEPSIDFETDDLDEVLRALEDENKE